MYSSTKHVRIFIDYNTTPTITIFVSLLFDKAVHMVTHILNGDSQGNTEFIKAGQTTRTGRVSLTI